MIGLQSVLSHAVGKRFDSSMRVICISTAIPKYLFFSECVSKPKFVVQFDERVNLEKVEYFTTQLSSVLGDSVPSPVGIYKVSEDQWCFVQEGLQGTAWMNTKSRIQSFKQWISLCRIAILKLKEMQDAISTLANFQFALDFEKQFREITNNLDTGVSTESMIEINRALKFITRQPVSEYISRQWYQHGDFCLNNFIMNTNSVSLIDFEHFGSELPPLHDEFTLVASLWNEKPRGTTIPISILWNEIIKNKTETKGFGKWDYPAFLTAHLCWWINETADNVRRSDMRKLYIERLCRTCRLINQGTKWDPDIYLKW